MERKDRQAAKTLIATISLCVFCAMASLRFHMLLAGDTPAPPRIHDRAFPWFNQAGFAVVSTACHQ